MAHKRKRSDSDISPFSTSTASSLSRETSVSPCPDVDMLNNQSPWPQQAPWPRPSSSMTDLRTRKRYRSNRPSDEDVHANTFSKLFAGARSPAAREDQPTTVLTRPSLPPRQPSLHNYWTICQPPKAVDHSMEEAQLSVRCEDCDSALPIDQDISMDGADDNTASGGEFRCRNCRRRVCDMCAVVEIGIGRDCLQCRTSRKRWVGGIGWVP